LHLPNDIPSCHAVILDQQNQLVELQKKVAELEDRLNKNSRNSNKPPSTDGLQKPPSPKPAFTRKKGKKTGGHDPTHVNPLLPSNCSCGTPLDKSKAEIVEIRQVFDIPPPKLEVIEHQKLGCTCGTCGTYNEGQFPEEVKARVQYGFGVKALVVLLNIACKLPLKKIQVLFGDLFGYSINQSTIISATKTCFTNLESSEKTIKQKILASIVAHFDETGLRVAGKLHWLHTACNNLYTYLFVHAKRGKEALLDKESLLPDFKNWAVHDCWSSYFNFTQCLHAICGAHILRELTALQEKDIKWAVLFKTYLLALYHLSDKGKKVVSVEQKQMALLLFEEIWKFADQEEPPPKKSASGRGRPKATKGRNLLIRLKKHQTALLAFAFIEIVPFTNNQAERDLRPAKSKQKVAGCFRTLTGAKIYARIFGFISTARKQQLSVFNELKLAFARKTSSF